MIKSVDKQREAEKVHESFRASGQRARRPGMSFYLRDSSERHTQTSPSLIAWLAQLLMSESHQMESDPDEGFY